MSRIADRILQSVRPPTGATVDPRWLQSDRELLAQSEVIVFDSHFQDYSTQGLFGKYKGIYWWSDHLPGHLRQGLVLKDYNILAPSQRQLMNRQEI
ncbi:MAG: hypothetical protein QOG23_3852 [Blastocatellia bacterium]|jgi:hypothetical protein|nr:hypothetical protein [Blastocatellia bacterium]